MAFYASNSDKKLFHKVLVRQLKKLLDEDEYVTSAEDFFREKLEHIKAENSELEKKELLALWLSILDLVNETYEQFDSVLRLKSRSLELSSVELIVANNKLEKNNKNITKSIVSLKSGVLELLGKKGQSEVSVDDFELEDLSELIKKLISKNKSAEKKLKRNNTKLKMQSEELERKNRDITVGIEYAKRIQDTILPGPELLKKNFPDSFILNLPKEIVSGDFFWIHKQDDKIIMAVADCTGHGVPGAFTSIISNMVLNEIVVTSKIYYPSEILKKMHQRITHIFRLDENNAHSHDGLDIAVCVVDLENDLLQFAGAGRPLLLIRKQELKILKGVNQSVGGFISHKESNYTTREISLEEDDRIYLFSDGYSDQFGGELSAKFSTKKFQELLFNSYTKKSEVQLENLLQSHIFWKGNNKQLDDILVVGLRYQIN